MKLTEDELLATVSEHTTMLKSAQWLRHIRHNEKAYGFLQSLKQVGDGFKDRKTIVMGAGPGFKRFGREDLSKAVEYRRRHGSARLVIVACDGALSTLSEADCSPDFVVSVDSHPVVANFFRRNRNVLAGARGALLATSIHRDVVDACIDAHVPIYWWQPWFKESDGKVKRGSTVAIEKQSDRFWRQGVTSVFTGGNCGTTSFVIASQVLKNSPIGLLGLEFAWSDETPLADTQYYALLKKALGEDVDEDIVRTQFITVRNPRDGKTYIADPIYYHYYLSFKDLWAKLDGDVQNHTYNLTEQGILNVDGLKHAAMQEFLDL